MVSCHLENRAKRLTGVEKSIFDATLLNKIIGICGMKSWGFMM